MTKGYWVSVYRTISDAERLAAYDKLAGSAIRACGGRVLSHGRQVADYEDGNAQRLILIEFDSFDQAVAARESAAYQEALAVLGNAVERDFRIIEGIQGISVPANTAEVLPEPNAPTFGNERRFDGAGSSRDALRSAGLDLDEVAALLRATMAEDLSEAGDLTSLAVVPAAARLGVTFTSRQHGVACGLPVVALLCENFIGPSATFTSLVADGDRIAPGQHLATLSAPARSMLAVERTALNLMTHLSGIATATRAWVDAVEGTGVTVRDTRKTTPLLRSLEK